MPEIVPQTEGMPRITLDLPDTDFQRLRQLAANEERDCRGQAVFLIRRALNRRPASAGLSVGVGAQEPSRAGPPPTWSRES